MEALKLLEEKIAQVSDLIEQIIAVNQMIQLHQNDENDIMLIQYQYRKDGFMRDLGQLMLELNIPPAELMAAA